MIKSIFFTLFTLVACLGICDIIYMVRAAFLLPRQKANRYSVVFLKSGYAVSQLGYLFDKFRWYGTDFCDGIIGITDDLSDTETSDCEQYCYKGNIHLCKLENLTEKIDFLENGELDERQYGTGQ